MARKPSAAARTSLYRLVAVTQLRHAVQDKYLDREEFTDTATTIGGREAFLISGTMVTESVTWAGTLSVLASADLNRYPAPHLLVCGCYSSSNTGSASITFTDSILTVTIRLSRSRI